jgi:hypothetical protein
MLTRRIWEIFLKGLVPATQSDGPHKQVGPIVSTPFYRAVDGVVCIPDAEATSMSELSSFRGPFSDTSDYLQSFLHAKLHFLSHHRSIALSELDGEDNEVALRLLERRERTIRNALELCTIYPGNIQICGQSTCSTKPFSLMHDDFRLSNIMMCPPYFICSSSCK